MRIDAMLLMIYDPDVESDLFSPQFEKVFEGFMWYE